MFEIGWLLPILGKIRTSPADYDTAGRRNGSFRATRSQHGKRPIRVPFCGFMENVCYYPVFPFLETDDFLCSGCGKNRLMVRYVLDTSILRTHDVG